MIGHNRINRTYCEKSNERSNSPGKKKILVFIPYQDDEILCAGNLELWRRKQEKKVFVCYATNGDYKCEAEIRMREAKESCKRLGIEVKLFF